MTTALSTGIRRVAARIAPDPTPDGELLARFLASRDEPAFATLVRRHAAMVFSTCRRVLGNAADADDAFQAAFVVLVRKAHSLTDRACVGNFLYGVAFHTALKARAMAAKRKAKEAKASRERDRPESDELSRVLDEELAKLPDKYRSPVVLCELEGVSRKDAAARLGIPEGTISSRLATAHRMLEKRLKARGFAAGIAAVLSGQAFAVSDSLADAAVRAAVSGSSAGIAHLATEVTKMFLLNKLKVGAAVLAGVVLLLGVGVGFVQHGVAADDNAGVKVPVPAKPVAQKDEDRIQGLWEAETVQMKGKQLPAGDVYKVLRMRFTGRVLTTITEDGEGRYEFELDTTSPKKIILHPEGKPKEKSDYAIYDLNGDTLKLCHNSEEGDAGPLPTSFRVGPQDKDELIMFKRMKEEKRDEDRIQGLWQAVSLESSGEQAPAAAVEPFQVRFAGDTITFVRDERTHKFELDVSAKPKGMNLTPGDGEAKGKKLECAIYELDGDTLKICMDKEGNSGKRPTAFQTAPKDGLALIVLKRMKEKKDEEKQEPTAKLAEPAWKAEFRKAYGLSDGQLVRRIAPPYPDCRAEYFKALWPNRQGNIPFDQWFVVLGWKGGWTQEGIGGLTMPVKSDEGVTLERLLDMTLKFPSTRIDSDVTSLMRKVTGDFVVRAGADPEKIAVQLEATLRTELELPVKFSFKDAEEEVFVLGGKYEPKPLDGWKAGEIEVYSSHLNGLRTGGGGSGTLTEMLAAVERHVSKPVVLGKVEGAPKSVNWHYHFRSPFTQQQYEEDRHAPTVLDNIAKQTGLTLKTEKRKVRTLVVEHVELKK